MCYAETRMPSSHRRQIFIVVLTVFIDLLGISLVIPVAAPLFLGSNLTFFGSQVPLQYRTLILGLLLGTGPVIQFFMAPLLGAYADRVGRKPVLLVTVLVNALAHAVFGMGILAGSLTMLFISRILAGVGSANMAAANSAIADVSTHETKVRNYGLIGAAVGLGFIFGPFLGGKLSDPMLNSSFTLATPLWVAAMLAVLNAVSVLLFFRETLHEPIRTPMSALTGIHNIRRAFSMPNLRTLYLASMFFGFGFYLFVQFFSVFLIARFSFTAAEIGTLFAYVGLWLAVGQGVLVRVVARYVETRTIVRWSMLATAVVLLVLAGVQRAQTIYWLLPFAALTYGLTPPNMTSLMSNLADRESQGEVLGIGQSMSALSMSLPPILSGWFVGLHVSLPMVVGAASMLIAWLIFIRSRPIIVRPLFHEVS